MKPKKSTFFFNQFSFFLMFFTLFVFAIFYRFMYKSDYQGTYGFNSFLCSCLLTVYSGGKRFLGFLKETSAKIFGTLCINSWVGYVRIREIRLTSFWTTHCSTLTDFDSIKVKHQVTNSGIQIGKLIKWQTMKSSRVEKCT